LRVELKTGSLELEDSKELNELVEFGSRINKKRGFLFVSKVLGKHIPTKPSLMREYYNKLASKIKTRVDLSKPTVVIGFAETATAMGNGVYDALNLYNSFYIHSTRYTLSKDIFFNFYEEHCHAPSHIFYKPESQEIVDILNSAFNIILVDDEVSTGNTANNLVKELKKVLPNVKKYYLVTYLDWMKSSFDSFENISLYKGSFEFNYKDIEVEQNIISEARDKRDLDSIIPYNFGRFGVKSLDIDYSKIVDYSKFINKKVLILGTGEFMYQPYLLALYLEQNGVDSYFQATTRSPVNIDRAIKSKIAFKDNYFENIDNFLYNVVDKDYDKIIICYETTKLPKEYKLKEILQKEYSFDVDEIFFGDSNV
jgi:hypoxanthine phosphoribosyltransferase